MRFLFILKSPSKIVTDDIQKCLCSPVGGERNIILGPDPVCMCWHHHGHHDIFLAHNISLFLCPRLPKAGVGHIAFRHVICIYAYVMFVTRVTNIYIQICTHIYHVMSAFLLEVVIWVPFMLGR